MRRRQRGYRNGRPPIPRCPSSGKVRWANRAGAEAEAAYQARLRLAEGSSAVPVRVYECPDCDGGWHLTKRPTPPRPSPRKETSP